MDSRKVLVVRYREWIVVAVSLLLYFQIYLQKIISPLQFLDEGLAVLFFLYFVIKNTKKIDLNSVYILMFVVGIVLVGIIGNYYSSVQTSLKPILIDMGNCIKIFMIYLGAKQFMSTIDNKDRIIKTLARVMRTFVIIAFVCFLIQINVDIGMGHDIRMGIRSFQFINNGAGQFSMMFYAIMMILTIDLKFEENNRMKKVVIVMALFLWAMTLRSRAFMFVVIYIVSYYFVVFKREKVKINIKSILVLVAIAVLFGMDQAEMYFGNTNTARSNLLVYGIKNLKRFFPIGSGFATFGTDAASNYYSKLYIEYGFNSIYGLSKDDPKFASDTYWGAIFGQFGFIGTVVMLALLIFLFKDILEKSKYNQYCYLAALFITVTQLVSSVATATFFNFVTLSIFFMVPLIFGNREDAEKVNQKWIIFK